MARRPWGERCTARRTDGTPCGAWAIRGGFVCRMHGGAAPQVRAAAHARLLEDRMARAGARWDRMTQATRDAHLRAFLGLEDAPGGWG